MPTLDLRAGDYVDANTSLPRLCHALTLICGCEEQVEHMRVALRGAGLMQVEQNPAARPLLHGLADRRKKN